MHLPLASDDLRRWAMQCYEQANDPCVSDYDRGRLMKMRASLLSLASNHDWLNGATFQHSPSGYERSTDKGGHK